MQAGGYLDGVGIVGGGGRGGRALMVRTTSTISVLSEIVRSEGEEENVPDFSNMC